MTSMHNRFVVLSGCSGGGKSTLLAELRRRGFKVVIEPGRRVVKQEMARDGEALPWIDVAAFARRAVEVAIADLTMAEAHKSWVFFDRSVIDVATALQHATSESALVTLGAQYRYHHTVFLTPPWPEIYVHDAERRHGLDDAIAEYGRLKWAYSTLNYKIIVLPRVNVSKRADMVLNGLWAN